MIRLSPAMSWSRRGDDIYVHGERRVLAMRSCPVAFDALMRLLESGCEPGDLATVGVENSSAEEVLGILRRAGCLVGSSSARWVDTVWERQADYFAAMGASPDDVHSALQKARVAILGLGGIGSVVLSHLASAGVGRFILVDGDTVQQHNLHRQLIYRPADVGRRKVDAAAAWLRQQNPSVDVHTVPRILTEEAELETVLAGPTSLLISAADTPHDIGLRAAQACLTTGTALTSADCGLRTASWGPLLEPGDLPAYLSAYRRSSSRAPAPPAPRPMRAAFGPTNAIAASHLAGDVLNWFAGLPVPSLRAKVRLDVDTLTIDKTPAAPSADGGR
ncbi:MAG TPA: ThiF family adenylyltransferase [Mycobacterium sp.]|nr:ThiF family adenylyltransferase [Mycobacterium sp.]